MAKGSVRKKGKKWYYRFYVEDASGKLIQRECVGTEIFIYCVIHTQRIFYSMVQNQRMCRNFSDIQMSVRQ